MYVELGADAEDLVTGFRGIVMGRVQYLTGCDQILLRPRVGEDGQMIDGQWFDETRISIISAPSPAMQLVKQRQFGREDTAPKAVMQGADSAAPGGRRDL